jgi:hypothetical protein
VTCLNDAINDAMLPRFVVFVFVYELPDWATDEADEAVERARILFRHVLLLANKVRGDPGLLCPASNTTTPSPVPLGFIIVGILIMCSCFRLVPH